ncbi:MAG: hypothetical protein ABI986_09560 [Chloroflexota bacterium]
MKQVFRALIIALIIGAFVVSCSVQKPATPAITVQPTNITIPTKTATDIPDTPIATYTPEPISTPTLANTDVTGTVLNIKFPFEPGFPGYLIDIKSKALTVNLMCILDQGKTTGDAVDLNSSSAEMKKYGTCDTKSVTLETRIDDQVTVTIILGGFPVVNEVTKSPDRITDQLVEFDFEYSFNN